MRDSLAAAAGVVWREKAMKELEKLSGRILKSLELCGIIVCLGMMIEGITGNNNATLYGLIIAFRTETILLPTFSAIYLARLLFRRKK